MVHHEKSVLICTSLRHNSITEKMEVDYTLPMGYVCLLSDALPSLHAPQKCLCEIQSHLSEVKWESLTLSLHFQTPIAKQASFS